LPAGVSSAQWIDVRCSRRGHFLFVYFKDGPRDPVVQVSSTYTPKRSVCLPEFRCQWILCVNVPPSGSVCEMPNQDPRSLYRRSTSRKRSLPDLQGQRQEVIIDLLSYCRGRIQDYGTIPSITEQAQNVESMPRTRKTVNN
jgi:hypothetical protein